MNPKLHEDAVHIVTSAIDAVKPDAAVRRALHAVQQDRVITGRPQVIRIEKN